MNKKERQFIKKWEDSGNDILEGLTMILKRLIPVEEYMDPKVGFTFTTTDGTFPTVSTTVPNDERTEEDE